MRETVERAERLLWYECVDCGEPIPVPGICLECRVRCGCQGELFPRESPRVA